MKKGFTLIELLVVISIIGLLSSVAVASLNSAREKARIGAAKHFAAQTEHTAGDMAVGIWDFDECSLLTAVDRSGFGNNGALANGASFQSETFAPTGCSVLLDGTNDHVRVTRSGSLESVSTALTISAWIKPVSVANNTNYNIVSKSDWGAMLGYRLLLSGYNTCVGKNCLMMMVGSGAARYEPFTSDNRLATLGKWSHVAGVFSGASLDLYIDGQKVFSGSPSVSSISNSSTDLLIGAHTSPSEYFPGYIDQVRIYAKALTASEVGNIYASEVSKFKVADAI